MSRTWKWVWGIVILAGVIVYIEREVKGIKRVREKRGSEMLEWNDEAKNNFMKNCYIGAHNGKMDVNDSIVKFYCECMFEKVKKRYTPVEIPDSSTMQPLIDSCVSEILTNIIVDQLPIDK